MRGVDFLLCREGFYEIKKVNKFLSVKAALAGAPVHKAVHIVVHKRLNRVFSGIIVVHDGGSLGKLCKGVFHIFKRPAV